MTVTSPLRYPGGKAKLFDFMAATLVRNGLVGARYCEPYAGGAGLAIRLLTSGLVREIYVNDLDQSVHGFWLAVLTRTDDFCRLIDTVPLTIEEWHRQKAKWSDPEAGSLLERGFATFYLNRTNRSGIIEGAGPIGGYSQASQWKIDARFNRKALISNIQMLAKFRERIFVSKYDAIDFMKRSFSMSDSFVYADPPYYVKGSKLYRNSYSHDDHVKVCAALYSRAKERWIVSYDDVTEIREIYKNRPATTYSLSYSAGRIGRGSEVIYCSDALTLPPLEGFEIAA